MNARACLIAATCLVGPASAAASAQAQAQASHIANIEAHLQPTIRVRGRPVESHTLAEEMAAHHVHSISIAVVDHGRIVWAKAYGLADVAGNRAANVHTVFQAGSISKPVAASGAVTLIQQGRLTLDAAANDQLTSWQIPDNDFTKGHPVTLRELLTHTAGLTVHGFPGYAAGTPVPSVVQVLEGKPPANTAPVVVERTPGSIWNYSGGGLTVVQLMMTDVTHQPFPDIMRERVFARLGMADSTYEQPLPPARTANAAFGYQANGDPIEGHFHTYPERAAAGLWTTPTDLAKWAIGLEQAYGGASTRLMSRASAKAMLTPGIGHWGLGVEVDGAGDEFHFTHSGDDAGFNANLMAWPKGGRAVVAMSNSNAGMTVVTELMQAVAREYGWKGFGPQIIETANLTPAQIKEATGSFGHGLVTITAESTELGVIYGTARADLIAQGGDRFIADPAGANITIKLGRGPDGKVNSLSAQGLVIARDP